MSDRRGKDINEKGSHDGFLKYGDKFMLFDSNEGKKSTMRKNSKNDGANYKKTKFVASHGFIDERVRLQSLKYCMKTDTVEKNDLINDGYFRDKLFFITPKLKYNNYEDLKMHNRIFKKLTRMEHYEKELE